MKQIFPKQARPWTLTALAALALSTSALAGCAGAPDESGEPGSLTPPEAPPPESSFVLAEFVAHARPKDGTLTIERIVRNEAKLGLGAQSIDDLNIVQDDNPGSGPQNTVEMVTNSVGYNADCPVTPNNNTFCGNVTLRHFYTQSLSNVFIQATKIDPATNHNAINDDPSEFGLDSTFGLWKYTNPSALEEGVLGQAPYNEGTRDWVFADPDGASTSIFLRVVASLRYEHYTFDFSSQPFIDACTAGTNLGKVSTSSQTLPFPFTLYHSTNTKLNFNRLGVVTFGNTAGTVSNNTTLPNAAAPKPALYTFWDSLTFNSGGALCYGVVGNAPNRQAVITWKDMTFSTTSDRPASLTFSAILSEGTNRIDIVYDTLDGVTERANGSSATVGVQDETASDAAGITDEAFFFAGDSYSFVPIP